MGTARKPGALVLLRHGQSTWNLENLFTGWHDVPLSEHGVEEAWVTAHAGDVSNAASIRVIEENGGSLRETRALDPDRPSKRYYWIRPS